MTTPQAPSTPDRTWGAAPAPGGPPRPGWSTGRKVAAGAVAVAIVAGGGAAVWAASSSSTSAAANSATGMAGTARPGGAGLGGALHGEYVSSDGNGGYTTKIMQTGEVTALSATSLTAKSDDGFTKTYTITTAQATGLATGDTVTVVATESGTTSTATSVTDGEAGPGAPPGQAG